MLELSAIAECPHCGCDDVQVLGRKETEGRLKRMGMWIKLTSAVSRLACNHCGRRWSHTDRIEKD